MREQTAGTIWRREFLVASGWAGAVAMTGTRIAMAADEKSSQGWIDAHAHIWTPDLSAFPLAPGATKADLDPPSFTTEELLAVAKSVGVDRVVLIQHHKFYGWDNGYMIDAARRHPQTFRIVGMVDDAAADPAAAMRRLLKQRVTGFRITPAIHGRDRWLASDGMAAMWRCAAETRQPMCGLIDAVDLPAIDAMCQQFPDTPVVIDHFARIGVDGEIRDADVARLCGLARHKHTFVKLSAYYALGKKHPPYTDLVPMIRRVFEAFGPQRLMWASDAPYQMQGGNSYAASLALVRDGLDFLRGDDRDGLLRKTAENVFFSPS
jgi:predicted TIM-barrel fold metal-dependent hydrolase